MCSPGYTPKDRSKDLSQCTVQGVREIRTRRDIESGHGLKAAKQRGQKYGAPTWQSA